MRHNHDGYHKATMLHSISSTARLRAESMEQAEVQQQTHSKRELDEEEKENDGKKRKRFDIGFIFVATLTNLRIGPKLDEDETARLFKDIPEPYIKAEEFQRIRITSTGENVDVETRAVCKSLRQCIELRQKWMQPMVDPLPGEELQSNAVYLSPRAKAGRRRHEILYEPFDIEVGYFVVD